MLYGRNGEYCLRYDTYLRRLRVMLNDDRYIDEHVPDLVGAKSCTRATFYEEIPFPLNPNPDHPRTFMALYQTKFKELLKSDEYKGIRRTSELFKKESAKSDNIQDHGDFDAR